jgi:hypothetical protein
MSNFRLHSSESVVVLLPVCLHNCNFSRCYKTSFANQSFLVVHQWLERSKQAIKNQAREEEYWRRFLTRKNPYPNNVLLHRFDKRQSDNAHASDRGDDNRLVCGTGYSKRDRRYAHPKYPGTPGSDQPKCCASSSIKASVCGPQRPSTLATFM